MSHYMKRNYHGNHKDAWRTLKPRLSRTENAGREIGGLMLSTNGLHNFYYLLELHDMRCKSRNISEIIRGRYLRDPLNCDVYMFMSGGKEDLQVRTQELGRMNVWLDEIMDELKRSSHKIDNLKRLLEKTNDRADKASLENECIKRKTSSWERLMLVPNSVWT